MRTRVFEDTASSGTYRNAWWDSGRTSNGGFAYDELVSYAAASDYRSMQDIVTPNFKARQARGEVILNPLNAEYLHTIQSPQITEMTMVFNGSTDVKVWQGKVYLPNHPAPLRWSANHFSDALIPYQDARDVAVTQAWANVDESEALALATLGELPETVVWINSIYKRAIRITSMFKNRAINRNLKKLIKDGDPVGTIADIWLEYRYAMRPLIFDMHAAIAAAQKKIKARTRNTARGWNQDESMTTENTTVEWASVVFDYRTTIMNSHNYRAGVLYVIEDDIDGLMAVWGVDQPLESIWELTPFSFIIDWFFNVGDIISSWSVSPSLSPLGSWITEEHTYIERFECTGQETRPYTSGLYVYDAPIVAEPGFYQTRHTLKRRIINPSRDVLPNIKINLDLGKTLDLAAISRKMFRGMMKA